MTTVLYIGGTGRSGSTLLGRMLGELPGFEYIGELPLLWRNGLVENALCGCSQHFRDCPFWTRVGKEAFGGWDSLDPEAIRNLKTAVDRHLFVPLMLAPGLSPAYRTRLDRYAELYGRLFHGIKEASGAEVIVESSARPSTAFLFRRIAGVGLRLLHLVRDSRAVAYAWTKQVRKPELDREVYMQQFPVAQTAVRWTAFHTMMEGLRGLRVPSLRVRYETLVDRPRDVIAAAVRHAGAELPGEALGFIDDGRVDMRPSHAVAGNPMRFKTGQLELRLDEEWKRALTPGNRLVVSALSWPLLLRYGYPLGVGR
jgi:hypothetical protein